MNKGWVVVLRDRPSITFQVLDETRYERPPRLWCVIRLLSGYLLKHMASRIW